MSTVQARVKDGRVSLWCRRCGEKLVVRKTTQNTLREYCGCVR